MDTDGGSISNARDDTKPIMAGSLPRVPSHAQGDVHSRRWEIRKKNARPGNYGSRIDYVLCSSAIKSWFVDANIQEVRLLGSDHCPVYATIGDKVIVDGATRREVPI